VPTSIRTLPLRLRHIRWATITTTQVQALESATIQESRHIWPITRITRHHDHRTCTGPPGRCPALPRSGRHHIHTSPSNEQPLVTIYVLNLSQHCFSFVIINGRKCKSIFKSYYILLHVGTTIVIIIMIRYKYIII